MFMFTFTFTIIFVDFLKVCCPFQVNSSRPNGVPGLDLIEKENTVKQSFAKKKQVQY